MNLFELLDAIAKSANETHDSISDWLYELESLATKPEITTTQILTLETIEETLEDIATEIWQIRQDLKESL